MEPLPVPFQKVQAVSKVLADEIGRSALIEILADSKLARQPRDELRRKFPDPAPWVQFVTSALQERERRAPALRALATLVERFTALPNVDHRLAHGVRKVHHAAERGDIEAIARAVKKLELFLAELRQTKLDASTLAFLACRSERARKHLADALGTPTVKRLADSGPETRRDVPPPGASVSAHPSAPPAPAFVVPPTPPRDDFDRELAAIADEPSPQATIVADFRGLLPGISSFARTAGADSLTERVRAFEEKLLALASSASSALGATHARLLSSDRMRARTATLEQLTKEAADLAAEGQKVRSETVRGAALFATTLSGSAAAAATALARSIETSDEWVEAESALVELAERAAVTQRETNEKLVAVSTDFADAVRRLSQSEADRVVADAVSLVRAGDLAAMTALTERVRAAADHAVQTHERMRAAAREVLGRIADATVSITESSRRACIDAIRQCDAQSALRALAPRPSEIPPSMNPAPVPSTRVNAPGTGNLPPDSTTFGLPSFDAGLEDFRPRNRFTRVRAGTTPTAESIGATLLRRGLEEIAAGSVVGVIDHALDLLCLAARSRSVGETWADFAFALLAALPASPTSTPDWSAHAQYVEQTFRDRGADALEDHLVGLVNSSDLESAVAERFVYAEARPFTKRLARFLWEHARHAQHILEELGRGIALGVRYGDPATARALLVELGVLAECPQDIIVPLLDRAWAATNKDPAEVARSARSSLGRLPLWLRNSIECFVIEAQRARLRSLRQSRGAKELHVQVPPSVRGRKMFVFRPGAKYIDVALLVGNPEASSRTPVATEIRLAANRNPRWGLAQDAVAYVGSLGEDERMLALLRLPVVSIAGAREELTLEYELRFRLQGTSEYATQLGKLTIAIGPAREIEIEDYQGAAGKPLVLEGDVLRLSSKSVQDARQKILERALWSGKPIAAVLIGRRRRGKTSLLATIAGDTRVNEQYTIVTDILEDLPFRSFDQAFAHLGAVLDRVAAKAGIVMPSLKERLTAAGATWPAIQSWLEELGAQVEKPTRALLLIDEFQKWISDLEAEDRARMLAAFRGLYNRPDNAKVSFAIVLSGLSNIKEYIRESRNFSNAFDVVPIRAFQMTEIDALIRSNTTIEFDTRAVAAVTELSGGNPFLANLIGSIIADRLREQQRPYCFREDVERAVKDELDNDQSRVWKFIEYLLKKGEEDHAAEIEELPALIALAKTIGARASMRARVEPTDVKAELDRANVECDVEALKRHLEACAQNELLVAEEGRYGFATRWLAEWLAVMRDKLVPVTTQVDADLVLGRYKLEKLIGDGGEGRAYLARDRYHFDRVVVVKVYARTRAGPALVAREAGALSRIEHASVVRCFDYGVDEDKGDVIVLERVVGSTLRELLANGSAVSSELVGPHGTLDVQVKFLEQILHGLRECHRAGVVHKDLKPENIVVTPLAGLWLPRIIDFGLAAEIDESIQVTRGKFTTGYVAPERYRGEPRRAPADIYSLGVVAYELLTGITPFGTDPMEAQRLQLAGSFEPPKARRPDIPQRLSEIVARMLSVDPAQRPTAATLAGELDVALENDSWIDLNDLGRKAYEAADAETAVDSFLRAALTASDGERASDAYIEMLDTLLDSAEACGRVPEVAQSVGQLVTHAVLSLREDAPPKQNPLTKLVTVLVKSVAVEPVKKEAKDAAIATLILSLDSHAPHIHASDAVRILLETDRDPTVWSRRKDIYLLGLHYRDSHLRLGLIERWCIAACRRERESSGALVTALEWLRRAERLGVAKSPEYLKERDALDALLRKTANPVRLPAHADRQDPAATVIGEDERGHIHYERVVRWAERLLRLHPEVEAVRRVRKDGEIDLRPTRILDTVPTMHQNAAKGIEPIRIIAAVLDASFCIPSNCPLRVNIILPKGRTVQERQAVCEKLQADSSLFGDAS